jgi:hypothetical protein
MLALVLAACSMPAVCATLERLSLDEMIDSSTAIVRGRATGSYSAFSGRTIYTHYTIKVSETYKGKPQAQVSVAVLGGAANQLRQTFSGAPKFATGQEYVLFLWTSQAGVTQVIGFSQGAFSLTVDGSADPLVVRRPSSEVMLERGTDRQVADQGVSMRLSALRNRISERLAGRSASR